jgi:hypothetical protein
VAGRETVFMHTRQMHRNNKRKSKSIFCREKSPVYIVAILKVNFNLGERQK